MEIEKNFSHYTQDKAQLVSEFELADLLSSAISDQRRSDFSLLMAMLSPDLCEQLLKNQLNSPQALQEKMPVVKHRLIAQEQDYHLGCQQSVAFHQGGIKSVQLNHYLTPIALHYPCNKTQKLPEHIYHNLSAHLRRKIANEQNIKS